MSPVGMVQFPPSLVGSALYKELGVGLISFLLGSQYLTPACYGQAGEDSAWRDSFAFLLPQFPHLSNNKVPSFQLRCPPH